MCVGLNYCFLVVMIIALLFILLEHSSIIYQSISFENVKTAIKNVLGNFYLADPALFKCVEYNLLLIALLGGKYSHRKAFCVLTCNMAIITWLVLPFTGLGMASKKEMSEK